MLWFPTDLLSLLKAVGGSGVLRGGTAIHSELAVPWCLLPELPFAQAVCVKADLSKCI